MPDPSFYSKLARLSGIITILPATMGAGWLFGFFIIDRLFHSFPWGSVSGTFLGAGIGLYEIFKLLVSTRDGDS